MRTLARPAIGLAIGVVVAVVAIAAWQKMAADREAKKQAAMVAEWERYPMVYVCERHPGERVVFDRKEPTGPDAQPDAEPRQMLFIGSICDSLLSSKRDARDGK